VQTTPTSSYVAYYRVSTQRQGESGLGLEAQKDSVHRLAGLTPIIAEYREVESGKRHTNRPELMAAIHHAKRSKATLLIAKLDRLARNVHFISGLLESRVDFIAADMPDANRLTVHIMAAMAEHEQRMISARTKAGLAMVKKEIAEKGFRISRSGARIEKLGNPKWAESLVKARAHRHPAHTPERVEEILRRQRYAGKSLQAIAGYLNGLGIKTPSGASWYASSVRTKLLKLELVIAA
jgi:DNA invertase Pin-like site-specific DNA recombinase